MPRLLCPPLRLAGQPPRKVDRIVCRRWHLVHALRICLPLPMRERRAHPPRIHMRAVLRRGPVPSPHRHVVRLWQRPRDGHALHLSHKCVGRPRTRTRRVGVLRRELRRERQRVDGGRGKRRDRAPAEASSRKTARGAVHRCERGALCVRASEGASRHLQQ